MNTFKDKVFTQINRNRSVDQLANSNYDLIVIGGGVTGAGILLDAALRGLRVLLVEKKDYAAGTSSKSTKLIHGGLRYLKQFEIGLVRETGQERAVAHHNIPHIVHPEKMLLPIVEDGTFSKFSASLAISVYDRLAAVPTKDRKKTFSKSKTLEIEPLLNPDILKSSIMYSEYRTDDARLTVELIKAARREGADAINYMCVDDFVYDQSHITGVMCTDILRDKPVTFSAQQVVSAAGPWVDLLRGQNKSKKGKTLRLTKGVHIVVEQEHLPLKHSVYFDDFDGRMIFAIPRGKVTYIGTSDTEYEGSLDTVVCTGEDMDYLLSKVNFMFEEVKLEPHHVVSTWAGLRPLIHEEGKAPSELSRKDEIFESDTGLLSIAGGKLTGFRKMAERIVDLVLEKNEELPQNDSSTKDYKIHVDSFDDYTEYEMYLENIKQKYVGEGISAFYCWYLCTTFGKNAELIIVEALKNKESEIYSALIKAEVDYCIKYESIAMPDDYFNRRSGKLYFDINSVKNHFELIHQCFQNHFGWSASKLAEVKKESQQYIDEVTIIAPLAYA